MSRKLILVLLISLSILAVWGTLAAQGSPPDETAASAAAAAIADDTPPRREVSATVDSPAISFIDSPSPTCYRPVEATGICYMTWSYLYVSASAGQYVISMTVSIDNALRSVQGGFFQTAMYIPGDLYGPGFKVSCGVPGSGGIPDLGQAHSYTLRARETGGLGSANYGSAYCPADTAPLYLPLAKKR